MHEAQSSTREFIALTSSVGWSAENLILEDKTYVEITNSGKFSFINNESLRGADYELLQEMCRYQCAYFRNE